MNALLCQYYLTISAGLAFGWSEWCCETGQQAQWGCGGSSPTLHPIPRLPPPSPAHPA